MHTHAPRRSETLTCSSDRAEENRLRRHFQVGGWANDERVVAAEFHDRLPEPAMDSFRHVQSHRDRTRGGDQRNPRVISQFLADRFPVADQQRKDGWIGARLLANTFGNFCNRNRSQRSFFGRLPNCCVATNRGEGGVPRPDRDRKIKRCNDGDEPERMPLLHQTMARPFRLNRKAVKHPRLADGEVADVDHLLHFAFAFSDDLAGLERDELTELVFQLAERVSQTSNGVAADWAGRSSPLFECFLRARDRRLVIVVGSGVNAGQPPAIDRRYLVDLRAPAAAGPFTREDAWIFLPQRELLED